jgi:FlaA1/EpsC-like NDP-sugar epimerase
MSPDLRYHVMLMVKAFDLTAICATALAALAISSGSSTWLNLGYLLVIRIKVANLLLFVGYLALCSAVFSACGLYRSHRLAPWHRRLYEILLAVTLLTGVLLVLRWPLHLTFAKAEFLLWFWPLTFCTLFLSREIVRLLLHLARLRGRNLHNVIIVGEGSDATALANRVRQEASLGYRVLRIIDAKEIAENGRMAGDI